MTSKKRRQSTADMKRLRPFLFARSRGMCEHCAAPITFESMHLHHRKLRSRGGQDTEDNLVAVCARSHEWIHHNPAEATADGWMVPSWKEPA